MSYTIAEDFTLPSLGKVYKKQINPVIKLRSMSTEDEMLRLSHSDRPYKPLCDMIESCIIGEKPGISVYDMCLADYQYLLHRLRVVTYGPEYLTQSVCRWCGTINEKVVNLDDIPVTQYSEELEKHFEFELPRSGSKVRIRMQTPRSVDDIAIRVKEFKKKSPDAPDPTIIYTIKSLIESIDGQVMDAFKIESWVRKLPMADTNTILKHAEILNKSFGLDTVVKVECRECGVDYDTPFRITPEFFGPSIDI